MIVADSVTAEAREVDADAALGAVEAIGPVIPQGGYALSVGAAVNESARTHFPSRFSPPALAPTEGKLADPSFRVRYVGTLCGTKLAAAALQDAPEVDFRFSCEGEGISIEVEKVTQEDGTETMKARICVTNGSCTGRWGESDVGVEANGTTCATFSHDLTRR